jgi:hypothetical protein
VGAPIIRLRAMNAVIAATMSDPTRRMSFRPSMTLLAFFQMMPGLIGR